MKTFMVKVRCLDEDGNRNMANAVNITQGKKTGNGFFWMLKICDYKERRVLWIVKSPSVTCPWKELENWHSHNNRKLII